MIELLFRIFDRQFVQSWVTNVNNVIVMVLELANMLLKLKSMY